MPPSVSKLDCVPARGRENRRKTVSGNLHFEAENELGFSVEISLFQCFISHQWTVLPISDQFWLEAKDTTVHFHLTLISSSPSQFLYERKCSFQLPPPHTHTWQKLLSFDLLSSLSENTKLSMMNQKSSEEDIPKDKMAVTSNSFALFLWRWASRFLMLKRHCSLLEREELCLG